MIIKDMTEDKLNLAHAIESSDIIVKLKTFLNNAQANLDSTDLDDLSEIIDLFLLNINQLIPNSSASYVWKAVHHCLLILKSHLQCRMIARAGSGDILNEKEKLAFLCADLGSYLDTLKLVNNIGTTMVSSDSRNVNIQMLLSFLSELPIPVTYWKREKTERNFSYQNSTEEKDESSPSEKDTPSPLIRVIAFIDDSPLTSPQILQPQLVYSIKFAILGLTWLKNAERLRLDLLTTLPSSEYAISDFYINNPKTMNGEQYEASLTGQIQFKSPQSLLSDSVSFVIRCAFVLPNEKIQEIPVIGHNQLEFYVFDSQNNGFFSGYRRLDHHIMQLLENLNKNNPSARSELPELLPMLESLTCLLGNYAQGAVFKQYTHLTEAEFQQTVVRDLRLRLGQDVEEHTRQAGGFTDIRYRGVIVELKVERDNGNRNHIANKYTQQSVQYSGAEARQVSILLVLDLTPKDEPPGDIRNDILLVDVQTHGNSESSNAFIFIVNGNIKSPSFYSR